MTKQGKRGKRGKRGATGKRGPRVRRADILAAVAHEFKTTHREFGAMSTEVKSMTHALDLQLVRMGQIQHQLDQIHKLVKKILDGSIDGEALEAVAR